MYSCFDAREDVELLLLRVGRDLVSRGTVDELVSDALLTQHFPHFPLVLSRDGFLEDLQRELGRVVDSRGAGNREEGPHNEDTELRRSLRNQE